MSNINENGNDNNNDNFFMQAALREAAKAAKIGEVPVGAVIVKNGIIIAKGRNRREGFGKPVGRKPNALHHAEIEAIGKACKKTNAWRLTGCTIYITLEPCPMCSGAIINSRIDRVVFGTADQKAGCCESVLNLFEHPFNHKPSITPGICENECAAILSSFFKSLREKKK